MKTSDLAEMRNARLPGDEKIVAVSLLTEAELRNVRTSLKHVYPVPSDGVFDDLLRAIDQITRKR